MTHILRVPMGTSHGLGARHRAGAFVKKQVGVFLINTGTPGSPSYWGVRKYLAQFLSMEINPS